MAVNNFLPWGDNAGNIMDGADYEASTQRTDGVELGLADPALHNRLYRQVTLMAAALGQVIADSGLDATDSNMADLVRAIKNVFFAVVPVSGGGTGASDAAGALANLGGFPKAGGNLNGGINFGQTSNALSWIYEDGRQWHMRPNADIDVFQVVRVTSDGSAYGYFNIDADGNVTFTKPLRVGAGGTGATSAAGARQNLAVPELRNGVVIVNNQKGIGTGVSAGQYWQLWNLQHGSTYPVGLVPSENGTQYLGQNEYRIKAVYANDYPCGTWNGNPIALSKGGLGRSFASEAALKTYLQGLLGLS